MHHIQYCSCWLAVKVSVNGKLECKDTNCGAHGQMVLGADTPSPFQGWRLENEYTPSSQDRLPSRSWFCQLGALKVRTEGDSKAIFLLPSFVWMIMVSKAIRMYLEASRAVGLHGHFKVAMAGVVRHLGHSSLVCFWNPWPHGLCISTVSPALPY